jgi:hypothetical protein
MAFDRSSGYEAVDAVEDVNARLGRAYIRPGDEGEVTILDSSQADVLHAWVETLIPGDDVWPSATDVPAVPYIDRTIEIAVPLRSVVLRAIDDVNAEASRRFSREFTALPPADRTDILRWFEERDSLAFTLLKELTYEVYYRDNSVSKVIEERTGFNTRLPVEGVEIKGFDDTLGLLADVVERPNLVRRPPE